tara:strand:- start:325 stop:564 length:240 start_codon:yes stop_codon:yes gene_type:complete
MPQIGWFEILIVVVLAILIIGPKDFPVMIRKIGKWVGSVKKYFNEIQKDVRDIGDTVEDEVLLKKDLLDITDDEKKKDE